MRRDAHVRFLGGGSPQGEPLPDVLFTYRLAQISMDSRRSACLLGEIWLMLTAMCATMVSFNPRRRQ